MRNDEVTHVEGVLNAILCHRLWALPGLLHSLRAVAQHKVRLVCWDCQQLPALIPEDLWKQHSLSS